MRKDAPGMKFLNYTRKILFFSILEELHDAISEKQNSKNFASKNKENEHETYHKI